MIMSDKFVYLLATIPLCLVWLLLYLRRKDLRKEIILASIFIGILSVSTSYLWWTIDWWRPLTITGTKVGVEDFLSGFASGGIMSVIYEYIFNKVYKNVKLESRSLSAIIILLFMFCLTSWLVFIVGFTTFWASTISLVLAIIFIILVRRDLFFNSLTSGVSMMLISVLSYLVIILISDTWVSNTYLDGLSGYCIWTIPVEEFVFWFLAGMWVGPFYEYVFGKRLK